MFVNINLICLTVKSGINTILFNNLNAQHISDDYYKKLLLSDLKLEKDRKKKIF